MTDEMIDTSDIPPLDDEFFARAKWRMPGKEAVIVQVRIDREILEWFKSQGDDWEQRMQAALRLYVAAHREAIAANTA
ncbi:MAG: BrnA antitoxin family protein [Anaerolineae bacterium]